MIMNFKIKYFILMTILVFFTNCTERVKYSGKIINNESINFNNFKNKSELTTYLGDPNYIDPIENKYFYIYEKSIEKNFFNKKLVKRDLVVATFDLKENIIDINIYNLEDQKLVKINQNKTENSIIERGLIEKIFGGVGIAPATASTP